MSLDMAEVTRYDALETEIGRVVTSPYPTQLKVGFVCGKRTRHPSLCPMLYSGPTMLIPADAA